MKTKLHFKEIDAYEKEYVGKEYKKENNEFFYLYNTNNYIENLK